MIAAGYIRVSTVEQGESGAGLDAQQAAIERECAHRGLELAQVFRDVESGSGKRPLPGRDEALGFCAREGASLMVAKLDRLGRSALDIHRIDEQARTAGFAIVALDLGIDTSTPMGRAMMGMSAVFAQLERDMIAARTRDALQARKRAGVRLGRPCLHPDHLRVQALALRGQGRTYRDIGLLLGVPASTVWRWAT